MVRTLLGVSVGWLGISMVADGVPALLLPYRLAQNGGADATTLGMITLVALALAAAAQPLAGHLGDRVGRLPIVAGGTFMAIVGLGLLLQDGAELPATLLAIIGVSVAQAGQQPLLPDLVPRGLRGRGSGLKNAFDVGGAFLAFVVLAVLLGRGDAGAAVGVLGGALVIGFGLTAVLLGRSGLTGSGAAGRSLRDAYRVDLVEHRDLVTIVASRFLFLVGIYAVGRFLLLFVADRLQLTPEAAGEEAGLVLALLAAITVLASLPGGWLTDRIGRRPLMVAGGVLAALGIGLLPFASSLEAVLAFGALLSLGTAAFGAASWTMLVDASPRGEAGRVLGLAHIGTAGAAAAAGLFGVVIDVGGYGPAFAIAALVTLAGAAIAWLVSAPAARGSLVGSVEVAR